MEFLSPRLRLAIWICSRLEAGVGLRAALEEARAGPLGSYLNPGIGGERSLLAESLEKLMERGLQGEPILESLVALRAEMEFVTQCDIERHLQRLPLLTLLPLMLLIFPSVCIVLFGPILLRLVEELQR